MPHNEHIKADIQRIQKLSSELANQIAAGEVIERPASVLKELLENSLDAGSTQIDIVIEHGGIGLIKVQDNGCGIHKEDLILALAQHATSKVANFTDLEAICSFGFRGEALASIASVSKLKLTSCTVQQEMGCILEKAGREDEFSIKPAARILGTTIEVRDLFYNTPARRQFLRSERTEMTYLEEVFKRIALSHPEVAFSIKLSEKTPKRLHRCLSKEAYSRRVSALCGKTFIEHAQYIEAESNGLVLKGWIGGKEHLRASADLQYFYVNGRIIRDKVINHALRQAYQESYAVGRYPAYILFLEINPASVDVNVHPTKHEVRFREARIVHAFLTFALAESLQAKMPSAEYSSAVLMSADEDMHKHNRARNETIKESMKEPAYAGNDLFAEQAFGGKKDLLVENVVRENAASLREVGGYSPPSLREDVVYPPTTLHETDVYSPTSLCEANIYSASSLCEDGVYPPPTLHETDVYSATSLRKASVYSASSLCEASVYSPPPLGGGVRGGGTPIAILFGEILILENQHQQQVSFIDIKACDEYLIAEQLQTTTPSKMLLIPSAIKIANKRNFQRLEETLKKVGFSWTKSGPQQILVRAIPACLEHKVETLDEVLNEILSQGDINENGVIKRIANIATDKRVYTTENSMKIFSIYQKLNAKVLNTNINKITKKECNISNISILRKLLFNS